MTLKEWVEYHGALCRDRELLHAMRAETYRLDQILGDVQEALRCVIGEQQQEDHPIVAELRRKVAQMDEAACLYYRADGTAEKLGSSWAVVERRKADARDLALLRARVKELEALLPQDDTYRPPPSPLSVDEAPPLPPEAPKPGDILF